MSALSFHIWKLYEEEELVRALFRYPKENVERTDRFRKISADVSEVSSKRLGKNDCFAKYKVLYDSIFYVLYMSYLLIYHVILRN